MKTKQSQDLTKFLERIQGVLVFQSMKIWPKEENIQDRCEYIATMLVSILPETMTQSAKKILKKQVYPFVDSVEAEKWHKRTTETIDESSGSVLNFFNTLGGVEAVANGIGNSGYENELSVVSTEWNTVGTMMMYLDSVVHCHTDRLKVDGVNPRASMKKAKRLVSMLGRKGRPVLRNENEAQKAFMKHRRNAHICAAFTVLLRAYQQSLGCETPSMGNLAMRITLNSLPELLSVSAYFQDNLRRIRIPNSRREFLFNENDLNDVDKEWLKDNRYKPQPIPSDFLAFTE